VRPEGLCQLKIPLKSSGTDPATFRLVMKSKGMKGEKNKIPKGRIESIYCCKDRVLVHVGREKKDVQLIATLHRAKTIETEKRNEKGETKKTEIIQDCDKITLGVEVAEQNLVLSSMLQDNHEMG